MSFAPDVWSQIKNLTASELIAALRRDGWQEDVRSGATLAYVKAGPVGHKRVVIHFHPGKTYSPKLLRALLQDIGWTAADLRRLKLIK